MPGRIRASANVTSKSQEQRLPVIAANFAADVPHGDCGHAIYRTGLVLGLQASSTFLTIPTSPASRFGSSITGVIRTSARYSSGAWSGRAPARIGQGDDDEETRPLTQLGRGRRGDRGGAFAGPGNCWRAVVPRIVRPLGH